MRALRRLLQVVAIVGTLLVGIVAMALIVSQTPWFRDWLRKYVVRESKQYLNGELSIGRLGGNLLFGVNLSDVAVDVSGERVIAVKTVELDYSVFELISRGVVLDQIKLTAPVLHAERTRTGWNLGRLVKEQEKEADREGPGRPITLESIEITDGSISIDDRVGADGYRLPRRIDDLDLKATYEYAPVHYSVVVDRASFRTSSPQVALAGLTGKVAVRDDNLYVDTVSIRTGESAITIDGVVEDYLRTPVLKVTTTGHVSLPEIGRVVPAVSGYALHPKFDVRASGPADRLELELDVESEAGNVRGQVTADVKAPELAVKGTVDVERLDLAPVLEDAAQRSDITGHAKVDLRMATEPSGAPAMDRLSGTYSFSGPRVQAAGYEARDVTVSGRLDGAKITIDGRAAAYGGTATANGFIVTPAKGRAIAFDLRGEADDLDLRNLPPETGAPALATNLSVVEYRVAGEAGTITGRAVLNESTVEGATLSRGMSAEFRTSPEGLFYAARGGVAGLNLQRIGGAMKIAALDRPGFDSRINGEIDVKGFVPKLPPGAAADARMTRMTVDASGTLRDSTLLGGRLPQLGFEAHLADRGLRAEARGSFAGFDPATLSGREAVGGSVTGTLDVRARIADVTEPVTPDAITADGRVTLSSSEIGGLRIDSANVEGRYAAQVADLTRLQASGPDVTVDAAGRVALDRASASNLKYHVEATDLAALAKLAGQEGIQGAAILDGTLTGNAASLATTGTLDGSNLGYQDNKALDLNSQYTVTVPELTFAEAKVEATTNATFVTAGGLQINSLTATTTYAKQQLEFTTSVKERTRELDATGSIVFHPDHQELHLPQLAVRTQGIEWRTAPGAEAAIQYGGGRIQLDNVRLVSGDQSLDVSGTLALEGEDPSGAIKATLRNVDLQQLETLLLQDRGLTGRLSADATVSGTAEAPSVDGHVEIRDGGFKTYRYESLVADVDYQPERLVVDATLQQSPGESITATGTVPMSLFRPSPPGHVASASDDPVDLKVTSSALDLGVVQGFTDQIANVTGTLQMDVRVTGSGQDPHLDGFIDIRNGAFGVPAGGVSYTGLDTRIELDPDVVRLQQFTIRDEHGEPLNVSGQLAVHEKSIGDVNVSITSDNFEVIDNELGDVGIDSRLTITGQLRRPRIAGDVRLEAARLEVDRILQLFYDPYSVESLPEVVSAERTVEGAGSAEEATNAALRGAEASAAAPGAERADATPPAPAGALGPVALDVQLRIPDNLVLRGNDLRPGGPTGTALGDLNITVGGEVRIMKEPGGPVLLGGVVQTVRGTYEFQGRRFDLVRGGTVRFLGEQQINPMLDVTATRDIPNTGVEARVRITGTAKAPQLQLSSTPPLEEADILALIVFNRPVNELGTGERASLAATAGGIATGFLAAPLGESIGRALDLDLFEITTTTEEGDLGAGLTVGQQIGDRAFFKLRQQFGERNATEFLIEYQLADFLRLQMSAAPETSGSANRIGQRRIERAGVDLIFFFSY